jgi:hypothetical protein
VSNAINIKTLRDYLKAQLLVASGLSDIKVWRNGQPVVFTSAPFGWVKAKGGMKQAGVMGAKKTVNTFDIVIVTKNVEVDKAEDDALTYLLAVENMVDADPTLNGQVSAAWVSSRDSEQWNEGKTCFSAWKVTVTSWMLN